MSQQQVCTFSLAGTWFGEPVARVQEVIRWLEITPVPLAPPVVRGMLNLRGQIVTAIDLRCRLQLRDRGVDEQPMHVVVPTPDGAVSLLVDEIGDVIEVSEQSFQEPPDTVPDSVRSMILGVYKLEGRLLHALDTAKACAIEGKTAAA